VAPAVRFTSGDPARGRVSLPAYLRPPWEPADTARGQTPWGRCSDRAHPRPAASACARDDPWWQWRLNSPRRLSGCHVTAAYFLIQAEAGKAAIVAAALRDVRGAWETASLAGPYDVIARTGGRDIDELARLVTLPGSSLDGVPRTMSCPVVHL
jgi:hypothetical protein